MNMRALCALACVILFAINIVSAEDRTMAIEGYCYLEYSADHSGTKVKFIADPATPSAQTDSAYTNINGYYMLPDLRAGLYDVSFSHERYATAFLNDRWFTAPITLPNVTLSCPSLSGELSGVIGPGCYHVTGNILVAFGANLQILAGTTLYFDPSLYMSITGTVSAQGTAVDSILFTWFTSGSTWGGIRMNAGSSGSLLSYCRIEHAAGQGALFVMQSSPQVEHCTIIENQSLAGTGGGVTVFSGAPAIYQCAICSNQQTMANGGGVFMQGASAVFTECLIRDNRTVNAGGGIYCYYSAGSFERCDISFNHTNSGASLGYSGGGIYLEGASTLFVQCTIKENSAFVGGGISLANNSSPRLERCWINRNQAYTGGGLWCYSATQPANMYATLTNCVLNENVADGSSGSAIMSIWAFVNVINCDIIGNRSSIYNSTVHIINSPGGAVIRNTVIAFNTGCGLSCNSSDTVQYCDIFGNYPQNISGGPPYIGQLLETNTNGDSCDMYMNISLNPKLADTSASDYHLDSFSHCIGAGDPLHFASVDLDGNPRPNPPGSNPDIGAYEHVRAVPLPICGSLAGNLGPGLFHVTCAIQVDADSVLHLRPGTTLLFDGPYPFDIYGTLSAEGTVADSVIFTADTVANPSRWRGLRFHEGSAVSRLSYCRIEHSHAQGEGLLSCGGGVFCEVLLPPLAHCRILNNRADGSGGGVYGQGTLENCVISGNSAEVDAGGVFGTWSLLSSTITHNWATERTGGISGGGTVTECIVSENEGYHGGFDGGFQFVRCTFRGNRGRPDAGAGHGGNFTDCRFIDNIGGAGPGGVLEGGTFTNCLFSGNRGGVGAIETYSPMALHHCTFFGNAGGHIIQINHGPAVIAGCIINHSTGTGVAFLGDCIGSEVTNSDLYGNSGGNIIGNSPAGLGNLIAVNSNGDSCDVYQNVFLDPSFVDTLTGDVHLQGSSGCIGIGNPTAPPPHDLDGNPRPNPAGSNPDAGCFENSRATPMGWDHGDLQVCGYPSLPMNPAHLLSGIAWLGPNISAEQIPYTDNQDSDDDGVTFLDAPWTPCRTIAVMVQVTAGPNYSGQPLYLNAWKDGNLDGDFNDTLYCGHDVPEWFIQDVAVDAGTNPVITALDPGLWELIPYEAIVRFRLTSHPVGPFGYGAQDTLACPGLRHGSLGSDTLGEVEDYRIVDMQLPVELLAFTASGGDQQVTLRWTTVSETNNDHFELLRNDELIARTDGAGTSAVTRQYAYLDQGLTNGVTYAYRLISVSTTGIRQELDSAQATPSFGIPVITEYTLYQNAPNPANPATQITFDLLEDGFVTLTVYNLMGQQVTTLLSGAMTTGRHVVTFDAADLPSGVYYYRLVADEFTATKKMLLLK